MKKQKTLSTLTIRLKTEEDVQAVMTAIKETGQTCASKAVIQLCMGFSRLADINRRLRKENDELRRNNAQLQKCAAAVMHVADEISRIKNGARVDEVEPQDQT